MRRGRVGFLLLFACASGLILAGAGPWQNGPWQKKDFSDWTDKDAQAVMTDSPWAKQMPMPAGARPAVTVIEAGSNVSSPPAASLGNPANTTSGANMSNPAVGGSTGPAEPTTPRNVSTAPTPSAVSPNTGAPAAPQVLTVIWASAAPIRLAVLKLRAGANKPTEDQIAHASATRPNYVIAVVGLPAPDGGSDPKALAQNAYLHLKGRAAQRAADSDYRRIGNSDVYFFHFPRAAMAISTADHEVEFKMSMGQIEVKKKFDIGEMMYRGQLAL
ncbi:MAG: hypothetical protein JO340_04735 [Acidobacteriaceae bacterium]|nr:hypothetical protein [Acidobacteriaceae bacterium]